MTISQFIWIFASAMIIVALFFGFVFVNGLIQKKSGKDGFAPTNNNEFGPEFNNSFDNPFFENVDSASTGDFPAPAASSNNK